MSPRKQRDLERLARLRAAERAGERVNEQGSRVESQLSLVGKLSEGWKRVHEYNHLASIFQQQESTQ